MLALSDESSEDGLDITFDDETGIITLEWDESSPYAALCEEIRTDNSLFMDVLKSYLDSLKQHG